MSPLMMLVISILIILVLFVAFKRPMYEAIFFSCVFLVIAGHDYANLGKNLLDTAHNYLIYVVAAFMAFSVVVDRTGVMQDLIDVLIALVGRFTGGAGYVTLVASTIMGSLSGSAPGSAAAVGTVMIPAMKKTGFSPELAASIQGASSSLGPIVPPSGIIVIAAGFLANLYPGYCDTSRFWICMWCGALWCVFVRLIVLFILIKKHNVKPIPKEERMPLGPALKKGWKACLLPVIVFVPFILDAALKSVLIAPRLGAAAGKFSNVVLIVVPSLCIFYTLLIAKGNWFKKVPDMIAKSSKSMSALVMMIYFAFLYAAIMKGLGITEALYETLNGLSLSKWAYVTIVIVIYLIMGCFIDPNPVTVMMGEAFIVLGVAKGLNPSLIAVCLVTVGHGLGTLTPPFALPMLVSQGIAKSDFVGTCKIQVTWIIGQVILCFLMLGGLLPMFGLVPFDPSLY